MADCTRVCQADTPESVEKPRKFLLATQRPRPAGLRVCAGHGAVDRTPCGRQGLRSPPQDTRYGSPPATPRAGFGPRDGAMRKRRSVPGPTVGVAFRDGVGRAAGGETREGLEPPSRQRSSTWHPTRARPVRRAVRALTRSRANPLTGTNSAPAPLVRSQPDRSAQTNANWGRTLV